jgi:hypothetical protein
VRVCRPAGSRSGKTHDIAEFRLQIADFRVVEQLDAVGSADAGPPDAG